MKPKRYLPAIWTLLAFFFFAGDVNAGTNRLLGKTISLPDSTCCPPDSLGVISLNCPDFCFRWHVPDDSTCRTIMGFQVEWKLLLGSVWTSQYVPYTSGTSVTYCGTLDTCGSFIWRVRTKCNDSTFSDWVYGPTKFSCPCDHDRGMKKNLSISPNPAYENITLSTDGIKPGRIRISILNMTGKNVFEKNIYVRSGLLREKLSVSGWRRGLYFISIIADGVVIRNGSFLKE